VDSLLVAFAVVFLAEFGDKTEVLTLTLAARSGPWPVLAPEHQSRFPRHDRFPPDKARDERYVLLADRAPLVMDLSSFSVDSTVSNALPTLA
jgi:Uncharacterized protein family UPF0016